MHSTVTSRHVTWPGRHLSQRQHADVSVCSASLRLHDA